MSFRQYVHQVLPVMTWLAAIRHLVKGTVFPDDTPPSVRRLERRVRASAEWKRLESQVRQYRRINSSNRDGALKFLNLDFWLRINVERVVQLGLHEPPALKILDLGSGPALFTFICRLCGHDAVGLDRPLSENCADEVLVYSLMTETLGVPVIRERIDAFVALGGGETCDVVAAFMICFNRHKKTDEWERPAWEFFLRDVARHLRPGGRLHLRFNPHQERYGELRFWSADTLELFRQVADVDAEGGVTTRRERIAALLGAIPACLTASLSMLCASSI